MKLKNHVIKAKKAHNSVKLKRFRLSPSSVLREQRHIKKVFVCEQEKRANKLPSLLRHEKTLVLAINTLQKHSEKIKINIESFSPLLLTVPVLKEFDNPASFSNSPIYLSFFFIKRNDLLN